MNEDIRLTLLPMRPAWLATPLMKLPMNGLGATESDAPETTGLVGSGLDVNRPLTAFATVANPDGPGAGLADRSLTFRDASGTCKEL